jgi:hypothetical protein
MCDLFP